MEDFPAAEGKLDQAVDQTCGRGDGPDIGDLCIGIPVSPDPDTVIQKDRVWTCIVAFSLFGRQENPHSLGFYMIRCGRDGSIDAHSVRIAPDLPVCQAR